jgi:uncharacterized protein YdhG (YjbR/CyaY superfamily)
MKINPAKNGNKTGNFKADKKSGSKEIDAYIKGFSPDVGGRLIKIRETIRKAAPKAEEVISYKIPAFRQNTILVYFAAQKNYIGFYPTSSGIKAFKKDISGYKWSKGAVQFPADRPVPYGLISRIVKFRVKEIKSKK